MNADADVLTELVWAARLPCRARRFTNGDYVISISFGSSKFEVEAGEFLMAAVIRCSNGFGFEFQGPSFGKSRFADDANGLKLCFVPSAPHPDPPHKGEGEESGSTGQEFGPLVLFGQGCDVAAKRQVRGGCANLNLAIRKHAAPAGEFWSGQEWCRRKVNELSMAIRS